MEISRGPRTEPWGKPLVTMEGWDVKEWCWIDYSLRPKSETSPGGVSDSNGR